MLVLSLSQVRPKASTLLACAVVLAAVSPATAHAVLAGTAALLFELAPFALAAAWLERVLEAFTHGRGSSGGRSRVWTSAPTALRSWPGSRAAKSLILSVAGCGCSGRFGGAVSAAALGLTWAGFGSVAAAGRFGAAIALGILVEWLEGRGGEAKRRGRPHANEPLSGSVVNRAPAMLYDALPAAAGGVFVAQILGSHPGLAVWWPAGLLAGATLGVLLPCTAGAVALAAALRNSAPAASLGLLLTAGILPRGLRAGTGSARSVAAHDIRQYNSESAALMLAGCACALLASRGGAGFVNPRLIPLIALGACGGIVTAFVALARAPVLRHAVAYRRAQYFAVPLVMFAALVLGSPVPQMHADETTLDGAFAGERIAFTGTVAHNADATVLVRYAITCCRADASPVALRLDRKLPFAEGTWLRASGTLQRSTSGIALRADALEHIAAPADPFVYR